MSRTRFTAHRSGSRIVFGSGCTAELPAEVESLGLSRILVLCSPRRTAEAAVLASLLGERAVGTLPTATEHVPRPLVNEAVAEVARVRADAVLALGGGSAIGLGKAVAAESPARLLAIPTSYSGSEMTSLYGVSDGTQKRTARSERVRPALVLYDAELTTKLPVATSVTSLWNALAHCVEALWWPDVDPLASLAAEEGLRALIGAMSVIVERPHDLPAREEGLLGAYFAGVAVNETGTALQHKLAHVLGGAFGLPHAPTHAVLLPHVLRYNAGAAPEAARVVAQVLSVADPVAGLLELARRVGAPTELAALGFSHADVEPAIDKLLSGGGYNPRELERVALCEMLHAACGGTAERP